MDQTEQLIEVQNEPVFEGEIIGIDVICRLCANQNERVIGIYSEEGISNDLANKMNLYLPVKVAESDSLPLQCCWSCASTVLAWHELVVASVEADRRLRGLEIVPEKEIAIEDDSYDVSDTEPATSEENRAELESATASLTAFCQEVPQVLPAPVLQHKKRTRSQKKKKLQVLTVLQTDESIIKEEWVKPVVPLDESLENYIVNIQNPFISDCDLTESSAVVLNEYKIEINEFDNNHKPAEANVNINYMPENVKRSPKCRKVTISKKNQTKESVILKYEAEDNVLAIPEKSDNSDDDGALNEEDICSFACQYCPLIHEHEEDIINHVKQEHPDKAGLLVNVPRTNVKLNKKERRKNTKIDQDAVNAAKVIVEGRVYYNCKICGKSLHSPYTYIWHMRIHTGERPYVCDLCGKQFRVSQGLVRHLRETHEGIKNFACDLCGRMFATRRNVEEHRRIHTNERPYICDLCGKAFKQKASLFVHNRSHTDSFPFRCTYCNQGFRTRPPLMIHVTRHTGEKPYPCDVCGRCFRIKYELKRHRLIHSDEKPFTCTDCGLSFRQKRYLRNHNKINHNRSTQSNEEDTAIKDECNLNTSNEDSEEEPMFHQCAECPTKFSSGNLLLVHKQNIHGIQPSSNSGENDRSVCEVCKTTFKRRSDMLRHVKRQHTEKWRYPTKRRSRVDIEYSIFCDICKKGFTRKNYMQKHRLFKHSDATRPHTEVKPELKEEMIIKIDANEVCSSEIENQNSSYTCTICDEPFKRKPQLNSHLKESHGRISKRTRRKRTEIIADHFCDICGKGFTRKFDMQKHRKLKHPDEPLAQEVSTQHQDNLKLLKRCRVTSSDKLFYKCEICNRFFQQSYNFMRHQTIHTGVRAYFCHICGKNFRVSGGLHRHITEHHYGIKKYPCDICGRSFAAKASRDDHRNIHTNNRPFVCDVCGKAFKQKASLHIHKMFHSDNYRFSCNVCGKKYRRASELKIHSWLHTGHKPHQCKMCGSKFRLGQDLKRHLKIHDKLRECVCSECGSTFSQERYLKNHKKTHKLKSALPESSDISSMIIGLP